MGGEAVDPVLAHMVSRKAMAYAEARQYQVANLRYIFGKGPQPQQKGTTMAVKTGSARNGSTNARSGAGHGMAPPATPGKPGIAPRSGGAAKPNNANPAKRNIAGSKKR